MAGTLDRYDLRNLLTARGLLTGGVIGAVLLAVTGAFEQHGRCRDVTFDPPILPDGVKGSDDPVLSARSASYAASLVRRTGEPAPVPAVRFPTSQKSPR